MNNQNDDYKALSTHGQALWLYLQNIPRDKAIKMLRKDVHQKQHKLIKGFFVENSGQLVTAGVKYRHSHNH